jgi:hypothetical protein
MWDVASGVGFVFYTQLEFRATAACEDFVGSITAQVYGALWAGWDLSGARL